MTKKVISFDLDDTLAITKSPISDQMGELLVKLLDTYDVCIISGGKFDQFKVQVVDRLEATDAQLARLHLMPTCGTQYYRFDTLKTEWTLQYAEDLLPNEKEMIIEVTERESKASGLWPETPFGQVIEDRGSQVSISFLGQHAPAEAKYAWAKENSDKRLALRGVIAGQLLDFEVRAGGSTTIDITRIGIDKAYGMQKLIEEMSISKDNILFIGDKLQEGGNDYPVKAMGIDTIEVTCWEDTARVLQGILGVTQ
jgi:HAD superfamily hydrolase (TIGR01484 family)